METEVTYGPLLSAKIELFRRGNFDFIVVRDGKKHLKQEEALRILTDLLCVEFLYGGAAGGAKSWTGCAWLLFMCLVYPGTKWFIGREELKRLRETTLITFYKVCKAYGVRRDIDYKYNGQDHYIEFACGSRIDLLDLRYKPTDSMYERYGSSEYTGGWIEEGGEINFGAYDTLKTRIGRQMNDAHGLLRKLFVSCNPKKNWMYGTFYKPYKAGNLPEHMRYLPCSLDDNPFIEKDYVKALESTSDRVKYDRLRNGNWEYDDNPNSMCSYDAIQEMFKNLLGRRTGTHYLTADIARFGSDKALIVAWDGYVIEEYAIFAVSSTTDIQLTIEHFRRKYGIPSYRAIADEDGVGGGVVDNCGILGFSNNASPFNGENYKNLQAQCAYKLAKHINDFDVGFAAFVPPELAEVITEDLEQLQTWKVDSDNQLEIKPKDAIKQDIGRSPDWRDVLLMRAYFDYAGTKPADENDILKSFA